MTSEPLQLLASRCATDSGKPEQFPQSAGVFILEVMKQLGLSL